MTINDRMENDTWNVQTGSQSKNILPTAVYKLKHQGPNTYNKIYTSHDINKDTNIYFVEIEPSIKESVESNFIANLK